jgi:hypothetical protein
MVISPGVVGSAYLSKIFDSEPVIATKLLIGVNLTLQLEKQLSAISLER